MPDITTLAVWAVAGGLACLAGVTLGPSRSIWRRQRRRLRLAAPLAMAVLFAMAFSVKAQSIPGSLLFAVACGAGAAASSLDLAIRRVHDLNAAAIAAAGLAFAALGPGWIPSLAASLGSIAILGLAGLLTSIRTRTAALGTGDILLAGACGLWISPGLLPVALLTAVAATIALARPWRTGAPVRVAFVPGLALGYGVAALIVDRV